MDRKLLLDTVPPKEFIDRSNLSSLSSLSSLSDNKLLQNELKIRDEERRIKEIKVNNTRAVIRNIIAMDGSPPDDKRKDEFWRRCGTVDTKRLLRARCTQLDDDLSEEEYYIVCQGLCNPPWLTDITEWYYKIFHRESVRTAYKLYYRGHFANFIYLFSKCEKIQNITESVRDLITLNIGEVKSGTNSKHSHAEKLIAFIDKVPNGDRLLLSNLIYKYIHLYDKWKDATDAISSLFVVIKNYHSVAEEYTKEYSELLDKKDNKYGQKFI